ncbi:hypothetical protein CRE_20524 [Caenorhabditis remanei]|uniref:Sdz-33 F-box domain-containing protein n=1 Tax=Caenorhabditis remanei TaxID=31234 RepID=E3N8A9_CAERE|nr:hypothetical protein CRE_20524 [Caenorhabditis remanei]
MYYLVKNFRDKSISLELSMDGEDSSVWVVTPDHHYHGVEVVERKFRNLERVNINGHLVPIHRSRKHNGWETYWDDEVKGIQSVIEYLSDLFGIKKVARVTVTLYSFKLLNVIKERQGNDYELSINYHLSKKQSRFILENYPAKVLNMAGLPPNFPIGKYLQTVDTLFVDSKLSITIDDLLNMNCVEQFLSRLLQHWAIGGFRRLKYLRLNVEYFNLEDVLGELTHTRMTEKRTYKSNTVPPITFNNRLITRNDGVVAFFQYDQQYGRVEFGVWPDSERNVY